MVQQGFDHVIHTLVDARQLAILPAADDVICFFLSAIHKFAARPSPILVICSICVVRSGGHR